MENTNLDAAAYSSSKGGTLFKYLRPGERFMFDASNLRDYLAGYGKAECVLVKTKHGYRHEIGGRQFGTGARVTVYRIGLGAEELSS